MWILLLNLVSEQHWALAGPAPFPKNIPLTHVGQMQNQEESIVKSAIKVQTKDEGKMSL